MADVGFTWGSRFAQDLRSTLTIVSLVSRQQPGQKEEWISLPLMERILRTLSTSQKFPRYFLLSDVVHDCEWNLSGVQDFSLCPGN